MEGIFQSGRLVDLMLLLMSAEGVLLWTYRRKTGRGVPTFGLTANLAAGACLLLALRAALTQSGWEAVALWLAAGLFAHLADLRSRWYG